MHTDIFLENTADELEILVFAVAGSLYGMYTTEIREVIPYCNVVPVTGAHPSIEGIFMPHDAITIAIDLKKYLQKGESQKSGLFINISYNKYNIAFHVDEVYGINRVSQKDILKPDAMGPRAENGISAGIIKFNDKPIIILDYEKIVSDIHLEKGIEAPYTDNIEIKERANVPIVIAEDSALLSKLIAEALQKSGYDNLLHTTNGQEAWDLIAEWKRNGTLNEHVKCVITDIEMPEMDGHRLTKLIKSDNELKNIPVVIFSSLINEVLRAKGVSLGADAQLSKPEIGYLTRIIDQLVL